MFFPREFPEPEELAELLAELDLSEAVDFQKITLALRWVKNPDKFSKSLRRS